MCSSKLRDGGYMWIPLQWIEMDAEKHVRSFPIPRSTLLRPVHPAGVDEG